MCFRPFGSLGLSLRACTIAKTPLVSPSLATVFCQDRAQIILCHLQPEPADASRDEQQHSINLPLCSLESQSLQSPLFQTLYNTSKQIHFVLCPAVLVVLGRSISLPQTTLLCLETESQWVLHFCYIFHFRRLYSVHSQIYLVIFVVSFSHLIFNF